MESRQDFEKNLSNIDEKLTKLRAEQREKEIDLQIQRKDIRDLNRTVKNTKIKELETRIKELSESENALRSTSILNKQKTEQLEFSNKALELEIVLSKEKTKKAYEDHWSQVKEMLAAKNQEYMALLDELKKKSEEIKNLKQQIEDTKKAKETKETKETKKDNSAIPSQQGTLLGAGIGFVVGMIVLLATLPFLFGIGFVIWPLFVLIGAVAGYRVYEYNREKRYEKSLNNTLSNTTDIHKELGIDPKIVQENNIQPRKVLPNNNTGTSNEQEALNDNNPSGSLPFNKPRIV